MALIQLDSHSDTWDQYWGSKYSHGTPVRRAVEEDLLREGYILQIGLRGQLYGEDDLAFVRDHKLRMVTTEELLAKGLAPLRRLLRRFHGQPTYLSVDILGFRFRIGDCEECRGTACRTLLQVFRMSARVRQAVPLHSVGHQSEARSQSLNARIVVLTLVTCGLAPSVLPARQAGLGDRLDELLNRPARTSIISV